MSRKGLARFAPLTGLLFLALAIASFVIGGEPPGVDDSTDEVVKFWTDNEGEQIASAVLAAWAAVLLVWFGGSMREAIARVEPERRLASIAFGGAVLTAAGICVNAAIQFAAADAVDDIPPASLQAISVLYTDMFFPMATGLALLLLASGIAGVRHSAFDRRLAWLAIVIGVICITPLGFFGFIASMIWIGLASVVLYVRKDPAAAAEAPDLAT